LIDFKKRLDDLRQQKKNKTMPLTSEQQNALTMTQNNRVSILTGAPGVGKTFTLKAILDWAQSERMTVAQASPTGKAAKQMTAATEKRATTIHSLLQPRRGNNGNFVFGMNEKNKLSEDLLILDECSMITNALMASVMKAIDAKRTRLLLVGDHYQLPSVGAGAILRDLIASGQIPCTELTEIQRNSGDIVKACHQIKDGKYYTASKALDPDNGLNLRHIECRSPERIQEIIRQVVTGRMVERGFNPTWDVQVLSPTNERTILSCKGLNKVLQAELNPNPKLENTIFRVNDKVIQTKNEKIKTPTGGEELVVNGDMGTIIDISLKKKQIVVKFDNPSRTVSVPLRGKGNKLLLGYSITCHRYQGSEAPVVIIPVHSGFNFFVNRPWLYTAISRAQSICITVGEFSAVEKAIDTQMVLHRKTFLKEKLLK